MKNMTQPLIKILPINELKNTASFMKTCLESPVPIVITNNDYEESFENIKENKIYDKKPPKYIL